MFRTASGTTRRFPRWRSSASSRAAVRTALTPMLDHSCGVCGDLCALQHQTGREQRQLLRHFRSLGGKRDRESGGVRLDFGLSGRHIPPRRRITRAEAMTMINRVLCRMPQSESDLLDSMVTWPDNKPSDCTISPYRRPRTAMTSTVRARSAKAGRS